MGYWEHDCAGCKLVHDAAFWYYRPLPSGSLREYLCGVKYYELGEKAGWVPLEPPGPQPSQ